MGTDNQPIAGKRLSLIEVFADIPDPRVEGRSKYDLVEMMVVTVCALVCGIGKFTWVEAWANERIDWLRRSLKLENGVRLTDIYR